MNAETYEALARAGVTKVEVDYHGSNDEGWINDFKCEGLPEGVDLNDTLGREIEQAAYNVLERKFPGWEINEGSEGTVTFDVAARKASIHHGHHIESTRWEDVEVA